MASGKPRMSDFDSPWKEALDLYFESFVAWALPTVHGEVDWSLGYEMLDKELQQAMPEAEIGRKYVDALAKVRLRSGREEWLLVHVEVQTQDSAEFARRMFVYHCRLRERYDKDVLSVAILADDQPNWKPCEYVYDCLNLCRLTFRFPIVKLPRLCEAEPAIGPGANPFPIIVWAYLATLATRKSFDDRRYSQDGIGEASVPEWPGRGSSAKAVQVDRLDDGFARSAGCDVLARLQDHSGGNDNMPIQNDARTCSNARKVSWQGWRNGIARRHQWHWLGQMESHLRYVASVPSSAQQSTTKRLH